MGLRRRRHHGRHRRHRRPHLHEEGVFNARLTVTDPAGKAGTTTVPITVGNTRPVVDLETPPDGSFFDFGDAISWNVKVTDPEEGDGVDPQAVEVQPALGHDDHAHPLTASRGLTGSTVTSIGGHAADENIFYAVDARYTDTGGAGGDNPLMGSDTSVIFPKLRQAEWFDAKSGTATLAPGRDAAGGGQVVVGKDGAWVQFEPVSFHQIETFNLRVQANAAGGTIELRKGSPTGDVVGTAEVPATGLQYRDVAVDVSELGSETMDLYLVFTGSNDIKLNFFEAIGQGISPEAKPVVAITDPVDGDKLDPGAQVTVAADATDADGSIEKVEFFAGDTKIGEDATAPYTADWTAPDDEGLYEITARRPTTTATSRRRGWCRCRWASSSATWCRSATSTASSSGSARVSSASPVRAPTPGRAPTSTRRSTSRAPVTTSTTPSCGSTPAPWTTTPARPGSSSATT